MEQLLLHVRLQRTEIGLPDMHAREGIVSCIGMVAKEFIQDRDLHPHRIVIMGPPCSGKSTLANHLGHRYKLPVLRVTDLIAAAHKLPPVEAAAVEQALKGGKTGPGRVPADLMAKMAREILSEPPAKNTGFILDGYPKTLREAREVFTNPRDWTPQELEENAAIEAALGQKQATSVSGKGTKTAKAGGAGGALTVIDDVPEPRMVLEEFMPNAMVCMSVC